MREETRLLDFHEVDGLALAASRGTPSLDMNGRVYATQSIGPFLELTQLIKGGSIPPLATRLSLGPLSSFAEALALPKATWISSKTGHIGFMRAMRISSIAEEQMAGFLMAASRAGRDISNLPEGIPRQIAASMEELESNIHEHADAPETGLLAFQAMEDEFEFVVADQGIGVLASLRLCPHYSHLKDEGTALHWALSEGVSRHGPGSNHGHGFRPIFKGLASLYGQLRFRSGDHALLMDGITRELPSAQISEKARLNGFFVSVKCRSKAHQSQ